MAEAQEVRSERERIVEALEASGFIVKRAAIRLGVGKTTLGRWIRTHGLDELLEQRSKRVQRLRSTLEARALDLPPAPHERSRQAEDQAENRAAGLCPCGRPPDLLSDGVTLGKTCVLCRARERERKRRTSRT